MKSKFFKIQILFIAILAISTFVACDKDEATPVYEDSNEAPEALLLKAPKIDICHNGNVINISENAWPAHAAHGDVRLDDQDGDGYVPNNDCNFGDMGDCNDNDASISPGATEVCDGIDNNCDGNVDEGVTTTFYADSDGDGFGNAAITTEACEAPAGYVANNTDCDDEHSTVYPGAEELCSDGLDNDCDGDVDGDDDDCGNPNLIENLEEDAVIYHYNGGANVGQTFTMGAQQKSLTSISVYLTWPGNGGLLVIDLYEINAGTQTLIASSNTAGYFLGPFPSGSQINTRTFSPQPVLQPNKTYAFVMRNTGANTFYVKGTYNTNAYSGGTMFYNTISDPQNFDMWFQVVLQ